MFVLKFCSQACREISAAIIPFSLFLIIPGVAVGRGGGGLRVGGCWFYRSVNPEGPQLKAKPGPGVQNGDSF